MEPIQWTAGNVIMLACMVALTGFLMGALARWIMPGPDPMSWARTILLGVAGSFLGGIVAAIFGLSPENNAWISFALSLGGALLILYISRMMRRRKV